MKNLMDYLTEYREISFREHPFSAVDALVLCQTTYPKIDGIVPADGFVTWQEIVNHPDAEKLYTDQLFGEMYREFMTRVSESRRYENIMAGRFVEKVSNEDEYQFAAVTFRMSPAGTGDDEPFGSNDRWFVAYRGTDEKVIGWKEDFNMGHLDVVPSQEMALEYLNGVPGEGPVFVGGHSKGGSQAVYSAAKAIPAVRSRLTGVYSFDGMGLGEEFYESADFAEIRNMVIKIIPDQSIIGTLFERPSNCMIVRSDASGFKQHDFMNWYVQDGHFVYRNRLRRTSGKIAGKLNRWIGSLEGDEMKRFVNLLYGFVESCDPENIYDMGNGKINKSKTVIDEFRGLNEEDKQQIKETINKLIIG